MNRSSYIGSIDGLRAVAVILVLLFHARFSFAQGGFIGVDVFFVISGFLITSNIVRDLKSGDWSLGRFYARRAARLLPALFTVLIATLAAGFFILSPGDLARLGQSTIYASFSGSNFFFLSEANYFDQSAHTKPLLHTWSLGVEEQFYLIWPMLAVLFFRWKAHSGVVIGMALLGAASLAAAFALAPDHPGAVFYLAPFRVWQFVLGALVALAIVPAKSVPGGLSGFACVAGLFVIAAIGDGETAPYWLMALMPALMAAVFLWSAQTKAITAVFASAPMQWLGKRSYSIYLTHWPIMVLWPMATDYQLTPVEGVVAIAASVISGALVYESVEKPIRFKASTSAPARQQRLWVVVALLLVTIFSAAHFWGYAGFPSRQPAEMVAAAGDVQALRDTRRPFLRCEFGSMITPQSPRFKDCALPVENKPSYLVIGDSLSTEVAAILGAVYPELHFSQLSGSGCVVSMNDAAQRNNRKWCGPFMRQAFLFAQEEKRFEGVILISNWTFRYLKDLDAVIKEFNSSDVTPLIIGDRVTFNERIPAIALSARNYASAQRRAQALRNTAHEVTSENMQSSLQGKFRYFDFAAIQCPDGACPIFNEENQLLYSDQAHFTGPGIVWFADNLRQTHPNFFAEP